MTEQTIEIALPPITLDPTSTGRFGAYVLDNYGAPKLSELTTCGAPPLPAPSNLLGTFFLNSLFRRPLTDEARRAVVLFGRRTLHAASEYAMGREILIGYLEKLSQTNKHFLEALDATTHFEQCLASACQAGNLLQAIMTLAEAPKLSDETHKRSIDLWNRSKHFDEDILAARRRLPEWGASEITAPVWLTNDGLSSANGSISFDELHAFLSALIKIFERFSKL